jgi:hypothetical protein
LPIDPGLAAQGDHQSVARLLCESVVSDLALADPHVREAVTAKVQSMVAESLPLPDGDPNVREVMGDPFCLRDAKSQLSLWGTLRGMYDRKPELKKAAHQLESAAIGLTPQGEVSARFERQLRMAIDASWPQSLGTRVERDPRGLAQSQTDSVVFSLGFADPQVRRAVKAKVQSMVDESLSPGGFRRVDEKKLGIGPDGRLSAEGMKALRLEIYKFDLTPQALSVPDTGNYSEPGHFMDALGMPPRSLGELVVGRMHIRDPGVRTKVCKVVREQAALIAAERRENMKTAGEREAQLHTRYPKDDPQNIVVLSRGSSEYHPALARLSRGVPLEQVIREFTPDDREQAERLEALAAEKGII